MIDNKIQDTAWYGTTEEGRSSKDRRRSDKRCHENSCKKTGQRGEER